MDLSKWSLGIVAGALPAALSVFFFSRSSALLALVLVIAAYFMIGLYHHSAVGAAPVYLVTSVYFLLDTGDWTPTGIFFIFFCGCLVVYYFAS